MTCRAASTKVLHEKPMSGSNAAYLDAAGQPRVRMSIVGFFDILGFSQSSLSCATTDDSQAVLDRISGAIRDARDFVRQAFSNDGVADAGRWALKFFSDNLSIGYPVDGSADDYGQAASFLIRCAERYQLAMAMNGYFVRGALTQGPICLTDEIIFGAALVESYQLESKASIVPRVVLTEPLQNAVVQTYRERSETANPSRTICRDIDGWWFVNYLQAAEEPHGIQWHLIERHKASILKSLSQATRHDVLPKFGWAARYHNVFCHWHRDDPGYSDKYRIDRVDEHSTIHRLEEFLDGSSPCSELDLLQQ